MSDGRARSSLVRFSSPWPTVSLMGPIHIGPILDPQHREEKMRVIITNMMMIIASGTITHQLAKSSM